MTYEFIARPCVMLKCPLLNAHTLMLHGSHSDSESEQLLHGRPTGCNRQCLCTICAQMLNIFLSYLRVGHGQGKVDVFSVGAQV